MHDAALCVRHWDWSETSQTVSLLTRQHGLVRAVAKGAKRANTPFSGGLELLTAGEAGLIIKPTSDLALLTEWDLTEVFPTLRSDLPAQRTALYAADLAQRLITDRDPHPELFEAALTLLRALDAGGGAAALLRFQVAALDTTGYRPVLDRDVRTGASLAEDGVWAFAPALGGIVADGAEAERAAGHGGLWRVRPATIRAITESGGAPESIDRANRLLASYIRYVLGTDVPTLHVVFPDLAASWGNPRARA